MYGSTAEPFAYRTPPELSDPAAGATVHPVVIAGAGPIGLTMAIDLAQYGIRSIIVDDNDVVSVGSRAICWSKRTLEILDRLGVGERMVDKGVTWQVGRTYHGEHEVYHFDLQPEPGHKMPAFINLQQYHVEQYLVERCEALSDYIDLRWKNRVVSVEQTAAESVRTGIETPDGRYELNAQYLIACDGANSSIRSMLGLSFEGQTFEESFLIADIEMEADFPSERRFWFEPTFHAGQSALLHKQPDNIYRIDLQLHPDADAKIETRPENVIPRIRRVLGHDNFELSWVSVYKFRCNRMERFVHERVLFVGDSAHIVSPFGARGGNGGIQDADNLGWKLAAVLRQKAAAGLLETYNSERVHGAEENLMNSSRTTNFMTPKSRMEKIFRDQVLAMSHRYPFARALVNSGRLSVPCSLAGHSALVPALAVPEDVPVMSLPGSPCQDAPLVAVADQQPQWLLSLLGGRYLLFSIGSTDRHLGSRLGLRQLHIDTNRTLSSDSHWHDSDGLVESRYGTDLVYLIRPDQHVAGVFRHPSPDALTSLLEAQQVDQQWISEQSLQSAGT